MNCTSCNSEVIKGSQFCGNCGSAILIKSEPSICNSPKTNAGFRQSIKLGFSKWKDYKGRSSRAEYWWFNLFGLFMGFSSFMLFAFGLASAYSGAPPPVMVGLLLSSFAISLTSAIIQLPLAVRRLHDINKSGYWLIPMIAVYSTFILIDVLTAALLLGPIIAVAWWLIWFCQKGDPGKNTFGSPPTYENDS